MEHEKVTADQRSGVPTQRWLALYAAWLIALTGTLAVLFVGEVMGQAPCNLCWYQRAFMFPLAIILGLAAFRGDSQVRRYAIPLALTGAGLAGFHSLHYLGVIPEAIEPCGVGPSCASNDMTILGGLPLPILSLAAFALIAALLVFTRKDVTA
jgi:disulfide bond formation protein DsbB